MGGAINNDFGTLTVYNSTFTDNTINSYGGYGGAICNSGTSTITRCNFKGNTANFGGAIYHSFGTLTVTGCNFTDNNAVEDGGAIYTKINVPPHFMSVTSVNGCTFTGNTVTSGKGSAIYNDGTFTVNFCQIVGKNLIYNGNGTVDAEFNWWEIINGPAGKISGFTVNK